ncbi:hypothetical protein L484_024728 [Morus notabilis]|uniref:Uncharacterized protein n=1 Tax=Morus notabilis TaxID=981085 RepID=W9RT98_9ROSA|nr:hypothetical protein L484_024728 [Morus notabilis]
MLKDGEHWMKGTATSCALVSLLLLLSTLVFTAIDNEERGSVSSYVRDMSESIALVSTSTLMFFSILTSNYGKEDFLRLLPFNKLKMGLVILYILLYFKHDGSIKVGSCSNLFSYNCSNFFGNCGILRLSLDL